MANKPLFMRENFLKPFLFEDAPIELNPDPRLVEEVGDLIFHE
ncbi:MAG: hypothetical protein V7K39_23650 [Nostoc sp.]